MSESAKLYQVRDRKAETVSGPLMQVRTQAEAVRHFTTAVKNPETMMGRYPEDFDLIFLGNQDLTTGTIDPAARGPEHVLNGRDWIDSQPKEEAR